MKRKFDTMWAHAGARMHEDLKEALRLASRANGESMSAVIRRGLEKETRHQINRLDNHRVRKPARRKRLTNVGR